MNIFKRLWNWLNTEPELGYLSWDDRDHYRDVDAAAAQAAWEQAKGEYAQVHRDVVAHNNASLPLSDLQRAVEAEMLAQDRAIADYRKIPLPSLQAARRSLDDAGMAADIEALVNTQPEPGTLSRDLQDRKAYVDEQAKRLDIAVGRGRAMLRRVNMWLDTRGEELINASVKHHGQGRYTAVLYRSRKRSVVPLADGMGANEFSSALAEAVAKLPPPQQGSHLPGEPEAVFDPEAQVDLLAGDGDGW